MGSMHDAAAGGDRAAALTELRNLIAARLDVCESGRDVAALSKRLMEVMDEIDSLPDRDAESPVRKMRAKYS